MRNLISHVVTLTFAATVLCAVSLNAGENLPATAVKADAPAAPVSATAPGGKALGDAATPGNIPAKTDEELSIDWVAEIIKGGLTSLALIILSAAAVGFAAERFCNLRAKYLTPGYYLNFFKEKARNGDWQALIKHAEKRPSIIAALGAYLAANRDRARNLLTEDLADMAGREYERHRQRSYPLAIIATMAPMLGLLGTMIGMIEAFQKVAILGDTGDASVLADSIGKALITTAVGLILAIPSLGCYHYLKTKVSLAELKTEEALTDMLKAVKEDDRQ